MISEKLNSKQSWSFIAQDSSGNVFAVRNVEQNLFLNIGMNTMCTISFESGSTQGVFDLTVVGTNNEAPNVTNSGVLTPVQTVSNTFTKAATIGECEMSSSHTGLTATISEAGLMNGDDNYFNRATLSDDVTLSSGDTLNLVCTVSYS